MFMGTPHRGSDIASALSSLPRVTNFGLTKSGASRLSGLVRTDLIRLLSRDSDALGDINESFVHIVGDRQIISCYETKVAPGLNHLVSTRWGPLACANMMQVVDKSSALLRLPMEEDIPLSATHSTLCRFASWRDINYGLVSSALVRAVQKILDHSEMRPGTPTQSSHCTSERSIFS